MTAFGVGDTAFWVGDTAFGVGDTAFGVGDTEKRARVPSFGLSDTAFGLGDTNFRVDNDFWCSVILLYRRSQPVPFLPVIIL